MVCKRITGKDYEQANTTPVLNIDKVAENLRSIYGVDGRRATGMWNIHLMHKNNAEQFKEYWGEQSCTWVGNGRFWIWVHEFENCDLYVMACPTRGTSYEIKITGHEDAAAIETQSFFKRLLNNLRADNKETELTE